MLTKTNYIIWRDCPKNAWLKVHKPDIYFANELSEFEKQIIETGNEVDVLAREVFPTGKFQEKFEKDGFMAITDILKEDEDGVHVYEVKATNEIDKKTHYHDLAFQVNVLEMCDKKVRSANIVHLNKDYVREGEIELEKLFKVEDVTEEIREMQGDVRDEMHLALDYIKNEKEPSGYCACVYKGRSGHCTTFKYSNPDIPEYGVHDLARIGLSKRKLESLVDVNIFKLEDIPEHIELSDVQKNQVLTYLNDIELISKEEISNELERLVFPLYFLDYETFPSALPRFDGYSPYQQIPFQYSLHVLENPDTEPIHKDFLHTDSSEPSRSFYESLKAHIDPVGSVIVWHKSFECGRNREVTQRLPETKEFFKQLDERVYDLEDIFKKQHYVHKNFKGSSSIKKVLPVLAPELSYKDLEIREGGSAAEAWNRAVSTDLPDEEREVLFKNLRDYCKLDTYAMYAIWEKLYKLI